MSRGTYFILQAHIETVNYITGKGNNGDTTNTGKTRGRFWRQKNAAEWAGGVEISKEDISGSKSSMHGYTLTYSWL